MAAKIWIIIFMIMTRALVGDHQLSIGPVFISNSYAKHRWVPSSRPPSIKIREIRIEIIELLKIKTLNTVLLV
jgi:hypothetical protein